MNHDEQSNDSVLTRELRDSLSGLDLPGRPPLAAITTRGRARQRRRLAAFGGLGVTGVAAGIALAVGLTGASGAVPALSAGSGSAGGSASGTGSGPIQTAAFTLTSNGNGTDTLTLSLTQMLDPAAFQQALERHGIPALVKTGTFCWSSPSPGDPRRLGVVSVPLPVMSPGPGVTPVPGGMKVPSPDQLAVRTRTVINPAKVPAGAELFFGYTTEDRAVFFDLISTHSYTCGRQPPRR